MNSKKAKIVFIVFITLFIMLSILMNLRGHLVIKKVLYKDIEWG